MDASCSCGARLPDDARFCHKCGSPQFELPPPDPDEPAVAPPIPAKALPPSDVSFSNPLVVRVGVLAAGLTVLGYVVPHPVFIITLAVLSGAYAVFLFQRRTEQSLSVRSGARLGSITGVFVALLSTLLSTLTIAMSGAGALKDKLLLEAQRHPETQKEMTGLVENPVTLALMLVIVLILVFAMLTTLAGVGGALGAKLLRRGQNAG